MTDGHVQLVRVFTCGQAGDAGGELSVADLVAGLGADRARLGAARKALERLGRRAAPVAAPLPDRIAARKERQAGYGPIFCWSRECTAIFTLTWAGVADRKGAERLDLAAATVSLHPSTSCVLSFARSSAFTSCFLFRD